MHFVCNAAPVKVARILEATEGNLLTGFEPDGMPYVSFTNNQQSFEDYGGKHGTPPIPPGMRGVTGFEPASALRKLHETTNTLSGTMDVIVSRYQYTLTCVM